MRWIWEWLTGLLSLHVAAGDQSLARAILGLQWGSVGSEDSESFRASGNANRVTGVAWKWLEWAGRGGRGLGGLAGGGAACSRRSPVNFGSGRTQSTRGGTTEALGCFIGTTWCTGGRGPASARERARLVAGARTGVNRTCQPRSNTWNRCFCPSSNADWAQIFANLGKIAVKDLFP
jgi:hypothetical protein